LGAYRWIIRRGNYATITGKAFRPRPLEMGAITWLLFALCCFYVLVAVVLPLAALTLTSFQRFATVFLSQTELTLANYETALGFGAVNSALGTSLLLGVSVATIGVVIMALLVWIIYRSRVCGASWSYQLRTVTLPLLRPGILAAWLLLFIASVRELGVSTFLVGPNAKVIAPAIVSAWISSSTELSAALALIQSAAVLIALIILLRAARRYSGELPS